ncbi:MAG: ankyrin repeat domain-containing protein, partial [Parachlamydiaceae bacterium]
MTERAILYLVTAYKIQKRCNGDLAALKEKLEEASNTCKLQRENNLLHHFISYGYLPVVKYLLKQKEAPSWLEQKNTEGRLPIHIAIMTGNSEITDLLIPLSSAELLNTQDTQGNTPLHLAVKQAIKSKTDREEFESVIEVLLKQGANPNSVNFKEKKPLDLAVGSAKAERISSIFHQTCLHDVKPESALAQLCVAFRQLNPNEEIQIQECYASLFNLLSHLTSLDLLENNLLNLLDKSAFLTKEQEQLALLLGKWYLKKEDLKKAMLCFAKALQMNRSQGNYSTASQVFFHYFEMHKEEHLERFFENSVPSLETMTSYVETIKSFKAFGIPKESLIPFFTKIANGISKIPPETQKKFENYEKDVEALQNSPWKLEKTPIERYWNALQTFRSCFTNQDDVQTIQKEAFDAMKQLIEFCIKDTQILIGPPPCHYDLRAMGSFGRKEMCPYSSLDCMLLIEDETAFPYFERMLELLELQIASLGETQGLPFVFTCISNPLKFHLNESPLKYKELSKAEEDKELLKTSKYKELIGTSEQMAQLQKRKPYSKNGIEYSALKTISLNQSSCQLYSDYEKCLQEIRKDISLPLFDLCKQNVRDFSRVWKHHFDRSVFTQNIKENFVKTLYYPLSDLAVYLKIESTNILEIADALIDRKVLPEKMRDLLKESISLIYQIRVRNHLHYTTQEEKVNLISSEIATLEKCYWQILIPLHTCLKKITDARKPHHQYFEKLCQTYDPQGLTKQLRGAASILDAVLHLP